MNDFVVHVGKKINTVSIVSDSKIKLNGKSFNYIFEQLDNHLGLIRINNKVYEIIHQESDRNTFNLVVNGKNFTTITRTSLEEKAITLLENSFSKTNHQLEVKAPMPGKVLKIFKNVGDRVMKGDSLIILEAMKMENDIKAPTTGVIENIFVSVGNAVEKDVSLFLIKE